MRAAQPLQTTASTAVSLLVSADDALRREAMAGTTGAIPIFHMGGLNQYGHGFGGANTDILAGGGGATDGANGIDVAGPHEMLSYKINNVEGDEAHFPLLWLRRSTSVDSGGAGRHHGGSTLSSSFMVHDARFLHGVLMGHSLSMPSTPGLHGGMPGSTVSLKIGRKTNVREALSRGSKVTGLADLQGEITDHAGVPGEIMLFPGDVLDWSFAGGGGWGDPLDAEPSEVWASVRDGRVSREASVSRYGVVLTDDGVDVEATRARREAVRAERRAWPRERTAAMPTIGPNLPRRRIGDRLFFARSADGVDHVGCKCGQVLSPADENWKSFAGRSEFTAEQLGPRIRLHSELVAEGYACPGCGGLLSVEVRWKKDQPLYDAKFRAIRFEPDSLAPHRI